MLRVENLHKRFHDHAILKGVSFQIEPGSVVGLIGPSGGGKSVLLKMLGGVDAADEGWVDFPGIGRGDISLMFQEGALFDSISVFDNAAFPLVDGKVPTTLLPRARQYEVHRRVDAILSRVGLSDAAGKIPGQLSGGMRRRLSLARALVSSPKLVLLDEPTCGLDPVASNVIIGLIMELHRETRPTTIMVSQDLRRLLPVVDRILALFDGRIIFSGTLHELVRTECQELRHFVACRYDLDGAAKAASPADAASAAKAASPAAEHPL